MPRGKILGPCVPAALLLLLSFVPARLRAQGSVSELTVIRGGSSGISCPAGYAKVEGDLNRGAGGDFIYLCTRSGAGAPLTGLYVTLNDGAPPSPADIWAKIPVDLNRRAGGDFIYLWYTKDPACATIRDIVVIFNRQQPPAGYTKITTDLNRGARGDFVYFAYRAG